MIIQKRHREHTMGIFIFQQNKYILWLSYFWGLWFIVNSAFAEINKQAVLDTNITVITAPEVRYMMQENEKVILVHTLSEIEYDIQHIPGSINIPTSRINESTNLDHHLPEDKTIPLIFYCMGVHCSYSKRASLKAIRLGYKNVYWFKGGIPEWHSFLYPMTINKKMASLKIHRLSPKKVVKLRTTLDPTILDVRPLFWQGANVALKNSIFIPLVELNEKCITLDKDKPIIIVDGYMKQSPNAARFLISKGYQILGILKGGIVRWTKESYPTVTVE